MHNASSYQQGFTLIEVMLVIVIMAVVTSLVVSSVSGIDERQTLQAREQLVMNLNKVRLVANDEGRVLGLVVLPATDVNPVEYQVVERVLKTTPVAPAEYSGLTTPTPIEYEWKAAQDFKRQALPAQSALQIQPLDRTVSLAALDTPQKMKPDIIWLGNGEMLPVQVQFFYQQQPLGAPIVFNRLGQIEHNEGGA